MTPEERAKAIVNNLPLAGGHSFVASSERYLVAEIVKAIAEERKTCAALLERELEAHACLDEDACLDYPGLHRAAAAIRARP